MLTKEKELFNDLNRKPEKLETIGIQVKRIYTDVDGVILDKTTVPASLQIDFPVYLWGEFDRLGAFYIANRLQPVNPVVSMLHTGVWGSGANPYFYGFSGLSNIESQIKLGDLVTVYTDNLDTPNYFIFIVLHKDYSSIASIQQNSIAKDGKMQAVKLQYYTDNSPDQWLQNFRVYKTSPFGIPVVNNVQPFIYRNPLVKTNDFIELKWDYPINQFTGILFNMLFATDSITLNFIFKT